jgi:hypothetical protein
MDFVYSPFLVSVEPLTHRNVHLKYASGLDAVVDVAPLLDGAVYQKVAVDDDYFRQVEIADYARRTICWPGEIDIAPERLHKAAVEAVIARWS